MVQKERLPVSLPINMSSREEHFPTLPQQRATNQAHVPRAHMVYRVNSTRPTYLLPVNPAGRHTRTLPSALVLWFPNLPLGSRVGPPWPGEGGENLPGCRRVNEGSPKPSYTSLKTSADDERSNFPICLHWGENGLGEIDCGSAWQPGIRTGDTGTGV